MRRACSPAPPAPFEDFTGLFVLHCHIFNHEDIGMMQVIDVYKAPT
jgi:hypothetical protein